MLLSILVATLDTRRARFEALRGELLRQLEGHPEVELLWAPDDGSATVGAKRNALVRHATGEYVSFVDDDDEIHPRYVELVTDALAARPGADCVGITVAMRFREGTMRRLELSARYRDYSSAGGVYRRPPHHLNPVRRAIALRHPFHLLDRHEDQEWALRVAAAGALREEVVVDEVLYRYASRRSYAWQWLLDRTERPRHAWGVRMVSVLPLRERVRRSGDGDPLVLRATG
jgi:glycosyltransferase involved in cell wall biosynthesis